MKNICYLFMAVLLSACTSKNQNTYSFNLDEAPRSPQKIVTKVWTVKNENGVAAKDSVTLVQAITYDSQNRELAELTYTVDGEELTKNVFLYEGDQKVGSEFYQRGVHYYYFQYQNDSLGRTVYFSGYDVGSDALVTDGHTQYLDLGRVKRTGHLDESGTFVWDYEYQLTDKGLELSSTYRDLMTNQLYPTDYKYTTFDHQGNWVKKQLIEGDYVVGIETREISYF